MEKPMVPMDCTTCKYGQLNNREEPCSSCSNSVAFGKWECDQLIIDDPQPILEGSAASSTHYQVGAIQPIEYLQMVLTPEEFQGFCKGNIIKYSSRCGHKDKPSKEAAKSEQYSKWLRMSLEGRIINPREDK